MKSIFFFSYYGEHFLCPKKSLPTSKSTSSLTLSSKNFLVWGFVRGKTCDPSQIKVYGVRQGQGSFPTTPPRDIQLFQHHLLRRFFFPFLLLRLGVKKTVVFVCYRLYSVKLILLGWWENHKCLRSTWWGFTEFEFEKLIHFAVQQKLTQHCKTTFTNKNK